MTFAEAPKGRNNNLNVLRFLAALMVIFSHAFPLTGNGKDFLMRWSGGQVSFGEVAVSAFFFYGGFLIMKSMERKKTAKAYFRARCLRIFPALWITVLLCMFVLGPLMTTLSLKDYLLNGGTWKYLLNAVLIPAHDLPGVFENAPFVPTVNGSLWTLTVEFGCYILCFVFYKLGFADRKKALISLPLVAAGGAAAFLLLREQELIQSAVHPALFFYLGMLAYLFRDRIPARGWIALLCAAAWAASVLLGGYPLFGLLTLPYILLFLAFGTKRTLSGFGRKRELAYGIYLSGWPLQQVLIACFPGIGWAVNFAAGAALSILSSAGITALEKRITAGLQKEGPAEGSGSQPSSR